MMVSPVNTRAVPPGFSSILSGKPRRTLDVLATISSAKTGVSNTLLGYKKTNAATKVAQIKNIVRQHEIDQRRNRIFAGGIARIKAIAEGKIKPKEEWEKVGAYMAIQGIPFKLELTDKGKLKTVEQDNKNIPLASKAYLNQALERFKKIKDEANLIKTKQSLRTKLVSAALVRIPKLELYSPTKESWEVTFNSYRSLDVPQKLSLDKDGKIRAISQYEHDFSDQTPENAVKLRNALSRLQTVMAQPTFISVKPEDQWLVKAHGSKGKGRDFYIDIDKEGKIVYRRNADREKFSPNRLLANKSLEFKTQLYILPDFLKKIDTKIKFQSPWEEKAHKLTEAKTPFFLDVRGSRIDVRELTMAEIRRQDLIDPKKASEKQMQMYKTLLA